MTPATLVELSDVSGKPLVKMILPDLRTGDRVKLAFKLQRKNGGRSEVLNVTGDFRVGSVGTDTTNGPPRQIISVESVGKSPTWQAVKNTPTPERRLPPARFPRTAVV